MNSGSLSKAPSMIPDRIPIGELEAAINRARASLPTVGGEPLMTLEVSTLASLYGRLIWERHPEVLLDALSQAERIALALWCRPSIAPPTRGGVDA
jgi:hypothetical protein